MVTTVKPDMTRVWASNAPGANIEDPDTTSPGKFTDGWEAEVPPFENFNFLQQLFTQSAAYFNENGIGEWDTDTLYPQYGLVRGSNGTYYQSVQEQTGNDPITDDGTNWVPWFANLKSGRRNLIINGNFDIWQRAVSQTATGFGSDDRWNNEAAGSAQVVSQQTFTLGQTNVPNNPKFYTRTVVTSVANAANRVLKFQLVEGVESLSGGQGIVSFWAKADAAKDIAVDFVQYFGSGGSPSTNVNVSPTTVSLTTSWKKFTVPITLPSITGKTLGTDGNDSLRVRFWFDAGSDFDIFTNTLGQQSGTFDISQIQMEQGTITTEFENRSIAEELSLCQRYYEQITDMQVRNSGASSSGIRITWTFAVEKRAVPTTTVSSGVFITSSETEVTVQDTTAAGLIYNTSIQTADAEL